ncbi:MAG: ABC transporter ATP-binding protein [Armatimonadetes bacterium]|nr:ABC transporter ATP-binding protein [Armatimonadota bacterium]
MPEVAVRLVGVSKRFGTTVAVDHLDLEIARGEFFAILGPSGCGKTTTLRIVAGLEQPTAGEVQVGGNVVTNLPPYRRNIGMVFQDYALFPHMTVVNNIAFGLRMKGWPASRIESRVKALLDLIRLPHIGDRFPNQLSGGQQQRVALARALAPEPAVLLLDEPLSNLDLKLRQEMRLEIRRIQRELGVTTIFVTHDQGEALSLSDRVMVMREGRVSQVGSPVELYEHPGNSWVASFLGDANLFRGALRSDSGQTLLTTESGLAFRLPAGQHAEMTNATATVAIRPESVRLFAEDADIDGQTGSTFVGYVENFAYVGAGTRYVVRFEKAPSQEVLVDISEPGVPWRDGTRVPGCFPVERWIIRDDCSTWVERTQSIARRRVALGLSPAARLELLAEPPHRLELLKS